MSKNNELPFCRHNGKRDCFACDINCKCNILKDTDWINGPCSFYKHHAKVVPYEDKK